MNLHEYQAKQLFARGGIPIQRGLIVTSPQEAYTCAKELGGQVVLKAQVLTSGRGRSGGIHLVHSPDEAHHTAQTMFGMGIGGLYVHKLLVEPIADIAQELYLGVANDRAARRPVIMASSSGGLKLHTVSQSAPEKIIREYIDPVLGLRDYQARGLASGIRLEGEHWQLFTEVAHALCRCFFDHDATLAEINPLAITTSGKLVALDGNIIIDDNALFRHPELMEMRDWLAEHPLEIRAREAGVSYIHLDGDIGCMVNGAGLAMTTMDTIQHVAGRFGFGQSGPANFLDIGGGARAEQVAAGLRVILASPRVRAVLVNIFGGLTRADEVARGVLEVAAQEGTDMPFVVRLNGTNAEQGRQLITDAALPNVQLAVTLIEATERAVVGAQQHKRGVTDGHSG